MSPLKHKQQNTTVNDNAIIFLTLPNKVYTNPILLISLTPYIVYLKDSCIVTYFKYSFNLFTLYSIQKYKWSHFCNKIIKYEQS